MTDLIQRAGIRLDATASSPEEAVALCGQVLVGLGAVTQQYADAMWEREQKFSSAIGLGFAIPHGTDEGTGLWDVAVWGSDLEVQNNWQGVTGVGYCGAVQLQSSSKQTAIQWAATDVVFQLGWAGI